MDLEGYQCRTNYLLCGYHLINFTGQGFYALHLLRITGLSLFYRGFPNNDPPAELNDDAAVAAVNGIYQAGIDALAERFGRVE